jgi:hypothetical protein
MTYFLRTFDEDGRSPFLAIPVFLVRSFRHGAIYINKASNIERPQDLAGKRIGELGLYGHDAGVIPKGILSDEFGVRPEQSRDYYRRTGIFPIMHAVVVTRELADEHPEVVKAVYNGFCDAKDQMAKQYVKGMTFNNMNMMLPWLTKLIGDDRDLLGPDWWPYGIGTNRAAIDIILRYHHEQGLTKRRFAIEDVFVPSLLDT